MSREIDKLIATEVMGLELTQSKTSIKLGDVNTGKSMPHYSTDIKAAWEVVEKHSTFEFDKSSDEHGEVIVHSATFDPSAVWTSGDWVHAETAPMAICLAALKLKGIKVPKEVG